MNGKKHFSNKTKNNSTEGIGIESDIDPVHPLNTVDRYPGDSVDEHKAKEEANAFFAEKEIEQEDNNL